MDIIEITHFLDIDHLANGESRPNFGQLDSFNVHDAVKMTLNDLELSKMILKHVLSYIIDFIDVLRPE